MELFKNIHRWHITYFGDSDASSFAQQKKWFGNDGLKAENLVTLELKHCDDDLDIAFQRFPNLRRLTIHPNCLAVEQARGLSLTHLTLTELEGDTATFFSYFRQFPSLISFEAPVNELDHHWSHPPLTPFTHTTLTELTITRYKGDGISLRNILANIHVPSIRRLSLEYWFPCAHFRQTNEMADIVHDFIRRHESMFTNFELSRLGASCNEMIEILQMFPKYLTSYASIHERLTDEYVKRLTLDPLDPAQDLAPDLSSISLYVHGGTPSGDLLAEMILSRWARNPHTTFKLSVGYYKGFNPLSNPRFARRVQHSPGLFFTHDRSAR